LSMKERIPSIIVTLTQSSQIQYGIDQTVTETVTLR
jgi:hypothetical protein